MGTKDPRLNPAFQIDFRIHRTLRAWKQSDPAPLRVKPIPVSVIRTLAVWATADTVTETYQAACNMIIIAFFFLLCPGKYTDNNKDPFCLADTQLFIGDTHLDLSCSPDSELKVATFASLTFTSQKNGVRGEVIGLACSSDPYLCPVKAIIRRVLFLRLHLAPPSTPLARVFHTPDKVTVTYLTDHIREAVTSLGPGLGFLPSEVSARCLRAAGATALLLTQVNLDVIRLISRRRLDVGRDAPLSPRSGIPTDARLLPPHALRGNVHSHPKSPRPSTSVTTLSAPSFISSISSHPSSHSLLACGGSWHDSLLMIQPFRGTKVELLLVKSPVFANTGLS
jgi:hypothetical protein